MEYKRRDFLKLTTALSAGLALGPFANGLAGCSTALKASVNNNFGLGLYTLRDELPKDVKGVLTQVASFGYKKIESYEHDRLGIYWGMKNTEFKKLMDDLGMRLVATHCQVHIDTEKKADEAAAIGMEYLIAPSLDGMIGKPENKFTLDDYKLAAEGLNKAAAICKQKGVRVAYHNHDQTFLPVNGTFPQDILLQNTDKENVDFEMDMYWVVTAGQDPEQWLKKYPNRFRLCHVKDRKKGVSPTDRESSVVVGTGSINYAAILKTAQQNGMRHFLIEQEAYEGTTPLAAVRSNAEYMKSVKLS
jgi:sugar phosphate isomerase/epimerase